MNTIAVQIAQALRPNRLPQSNLNRFAGETPEQIADHREIARKYQRKKSRPSKHNVRLGQLNRFIADRFGPELPFDDEGADLVYVMACHLAHLRDPETRIREWVALRAPWYRGVDYLMRKVRDKPMKLDADSVGREIGLDDATKDRLKLTTIGAVGDSKAKRARRRKKRKNAARQADRAKAGAKPHAASTERAKPWITEGISRRTWYRRQAQVGTDGTVSRTAETASQVESMKQCHGASACEPRPSGRSEGHSRVSPAVILIRCIQGLMTLGLR